MKPTYRAMPLRRDFWRTLPALIREGVMPVFEDFPSREDARNAAQAILIDHIERELMANFIRPKLPRRGEFYAEFFTAYEEAVTREEFRVWDQIGREFEDWSRAYSEHDTSNEKMLAYLTSMSIQEGPPQSVELYMNMAPCARAYEQLMRTKYGEAFSSELFYDTLRSRFPVFLVRYIGMDNILGSLYTINLPTTETVPKSGRIVDSESMYDTCAFCLDEQDTLMFTSEFSKLICEHARTQKFETCPQGRMEDRGCPVLFTRERDAILAFAITELIEQHRLFYQ